jgi:Kef-type K+ transport system membrane component KefB
MKLLLSITALLEGVTGLALIAVPSVVVSILLGTSLTEPGLGLLARIGGVVLTSLAIVCWLSRNETKAGRVMVKVMVFYNVTGIILLGYAGVAEHLSGVGLWPAVLLHAILLIWCVVKS